MSQKQRDKKMLNLWADPETIGQVAELQEGLGTFKSEVLRRAIAEMHDRYKAGQYNKKSLVQRVDELEKRLSAIEAGNKSTHEAPRKPSEPQKTSEPAKAPQADKKAPSAQPKAVTTAGKNFHPDEITRMLQEKPADWSDEKLAEEMNKKGLTTAFGKPCSKSAIHKWRHNLNTRGTI